MQRVSRQASSVPATCLLRCRLRWARQLSAPSRPARPYWRCCARCETRSLASPSQRVRPRAACLPIAAAGADAPAPVRRPAGAIRGQAGGYLCRGPGPPGADGGHRRPAPHGLAAQRRVGGGAARAAGRRAHAAAPAGHPCGHAARWPAFCSRSGRVLSLAARVQRPPRRRCWRGRARCRGCWRWRRARARPARWPRRCRRPRPPCAFRPWRCWTTCLPRCGWCAHVALLLMRPPSAQCFVDYHTDCQACEMRLMQLHRHLFRNE